MTGQEADFDADLDFDRFGMTGFCEALTSKTALRMSSSFIGYREMGLPWLPFFICQIILRSEALDLQKLNFFLGIIN